MFITEIFKSIQGEGTRAGLPSIFVRLTGCNLRCTWCDTAYAFHGGQKVSVDEVMERVESLNRRPDRNAGGVSLVELTGGEPLLQEEIYPLAERLLAAGYTVMIETSGERFIGRLPKDVIKIVDVKCPDSGEADTFDARNLEAVDVKDEIKFVLSTRRDYEFARFYAGACAGYAGEAGAVFAGVCGPERQVAGTGTARAGRMDSCRWTARAAGIAVAQIYLASSDAGSVSDGNGRDTWRAKSGGAVKRWNGFMRLRGDCGRKARRCEHRAAACKLWAAYGIARSTGVPRNSGFLQGHATVDGAAGSLPSDRRLGADGCQHCGSRKRTQRGGIAWQRNSGNLRSLSQRAFSVRRSELGGGYWRERDL